MQNTEDDFEEIAAKNLTKITNSLSKIGYQEGASDGRESVFQKGFDIGYEEGFKNGFNIGRYHGKYIAVNQNNNLDPKTKVDHKLLEHPTRGQCQVCKNQNLINESISTIVKVQQSYFNEFNKTLQ